MSNNLPHIIAICGYKGSGKDTIANYLHKSHNYINIKFADKLKQIICIICDISLEQLESFKDIPIPQIPELNHLNITDNSITLRLFMQFIGTDMFQYKIKEMHQSIYQNNEFWAKSLFTKKMAENIINNNKKYVISDLRFIHEYNTLVNFCKEHNLTYKILLVERDNILHLETHVSEMQYKLIPYHYIIPNNSDINYLYYIIYNLFK